MLETIDAGDGSKITICDGRVCRECYEQDCTFARLNEDGVICEQDLCYDNEEEEE